MKPRALIQAYNLVLSFDSNQPDEKLETEVSDLLVTINRLLALHLGHALPQLRFEDATKKMKIGVKTYKKGDLDEG